MAVRIFPVTVYHKFFLDEAAFEVFKVENPDLSEEDAIDQFIMDHFSNVKGSKIRDIIIGEEETAAFAAIK